MWYILIRRGGNSKCNQHIEHLKYQTCEVRSNMNGLLVINVMFSGSY